MRKPAFFDTIWARLLGALVVIGCVALLVRFYPWIIDGLLAVSPDGGAPAGD